MLMDILYDMLVWVENFIFLVDFVIFNCEVNFDVTIILGRSFLAIGHSIVDIVLG